MLQYMRSLQPDPREYEGVLFRYIFINLLPDVVREVVSSMDDLDEMAEKATDIYQANALALVSAVSTPSEVFSPSVNAVRQPPPPRQSGPPGSSSGNRRRGLCRRHSCFGRDAHRCDRPESCPMHDFAPPRPRR